MIAQRLRTPLGVQLSLGAAFVALSCLVAAGACTRLDQYAIDHWMVHIGAGPAHNALSSAFRPYPSGGSVAETAFNVWTFPGSVLVSGALLALCCAVLARRGRRRAAVAWAVAWVVVNAIEVAGKGLLHRPALSAMVNGAPVHVANFDASFPSGHTARALLLAFMVTSVWPRLVWAAGVWAAGACVFLVVSGAHTPSDVVGGALVALLVVTCVPTRWRNEPRPLEIRSRRRALAHPPSEKR